MEEWLMKKILSALTAMAVAAGTMAVSASAEDTGMRDITTAELIKDMGVGINLGNTFEATSNSAKTVKQFETAWGSPVITQEMIRGIADEGFGTLRIPVAWSNMMDMEDYTISPEYMARVKEVTDWAVDAGLYVIVNIHWDGGWWEKFPTEKDECMYRYTRMWQQICDGFADFDDHVIFESLNEEGGWDSVWDQWSGTQEQKEESYGLLNEINQTFVDLVRSQDNNNGKRHLLIAGYKTDISRTCDDLYKMPEDPLNRCAVSVHYYDPSPFALAEADTTWATPRTYWGTKADYDNMNNMLDTVKEKFTDNGVPVIVGECACASRLNKTAGECTRYNLAVVGAIADRGMLPVIWDVTMGQDNSERTYSIYNRLTCKLGDDNFKAGLEDILAGKKAASIEAPTYFAVEGDDEPFAIEASTDGGKLTYYSEDEKIAAVDENGVVTPLRTGTVPIIVRSEATDSSRVCEKVVVVRVKSDKTGVDDSSEADPSSAYEPSSSDTGSSAADVSSSSSSGSDSTSSSSKASGSSSSKQSSSSSTNNPATGAAAGFGVTAVLLAAITVIRKKK